MRTLSRLKPFPVPPVCRFPVYGSNVGFQHVKAGVLPLDEPGPVASKPARVIHASGFVVSSDFHCPFSNFGIFMWICWTFLCYLTERGSDVIDEWYREQPEALQAKFDTRLRCDSTRVPIGYAPVSTCLGRSAQDLVRYGSHGIRSNTGQLVSRQARWNLPWFL
jgi:hypothetical protein